MLEFKDFKIEEHVLQSLEELGNDLDCFYGEVRKILIATSEELKSKRLYMLQKLEKNLNSDPENKYLDVPDKKSVVFRGSKKLKLTSKPIAERLVDEFKKFDIDETWNNYLAENQTEVLRKTTPPDIEELRWLGTVNADIWNWRMKVYY